MKKMLTFISWAWQSLKYWCDPAMEGDPYVREEEEKRIDTNFGKISRASINLKQI